MGGIILNPPEDEAKTWGVLAHVSEDERRRIMSLPAGQFKAAVSRIEKEVKEARKRSKTNSYGGW